jgi:preprotein translocase subunit SecA
MRLFGSERIAKLMDRMGHKEGEVISHSMISNSIERAQKKVEENNFGIRKRLLEYDDVMNAQREVIYTKRRHALFGERLSLDLVNMQYDVSEAIVNMHLPENNFDDFRLDLIRYLAIESPVDAKAFMQIKSDDLVTKVFEAAHDHYRAKSKMIAEKAFPVLNDIFMNQGSTIENIVVPFTDGQHNIQVVANLKRAHETRGLELISAFERSVTLALIDNAWKEHLREMDDLKTSVQNAVYEQKDPLLIYKFESFELFKQMIEKVNKEILSFLFKGHIAMQESSNVREARPPQRTDMSKLRTSHADAGPAGRAPGMPGPGGAQTATAPPPPKVQPVRVEHKVGRNDPCPCGSGKKYKNCHGVGAE